MHELLGRQEVQHLVDNLSKIAPKVVEELIPNVLTIGSVQQVLAHLLKEQVSIRDLRSVLEVLADWAPSIKSPERLAEFVRRKFARAITAKFVTPDGVLPLVSLSPSVERMMNEALQQTDEGSFLALEPGNAQVLINKLGRAAEKFGELGQNPVLLAPGHLRPAVFHFVDRFAPGYAVLSHYEIAPSTKVQSLGVVSIGE
jgi:flagellar biosynthesis protein FlhA